MQPGELVTPPPEMQAEQPGESGTAPEPGARIFVRFVEGLTDREMRPVAMNVIPRGETRCWWVHPDDVPKVAAWMKAEEARGVAVTDLIDILVASGVCVKGRR